MISNRAVASTRRRSVPTSPVVAAPPGRRHHEHVFTSRGPAIETRADRLDSWKEIAAFLDRTVRTVQRWEQQEGLPVYRHLHARGQSVYAYKQEVAAWQLLRSTRKPPAAPIPAASPDWLSQLCYLCLN